MGFVKPILLIFVFIPFITCLNRCQVSPKWRLSNHTYPNDFPGKVKLVAFLKSSCGFCINQSQKLDELNDQLKSSNYTNVSFVIVNSPEKCCLNRASVFRNLSLNIPVLQDLPRINIWKKFQASVDDMLIFDKCDRLVLHMKLPDSMIHLGKVKNAVIRVYDNSPCGSTCRKPIDKAGSPTENSRRRIL